VDIIHEGIVVPARTTPVAITTFGYRHADAPVAHITLDLRIHFKDPHVDPHLRYLTARDAEIRTAVLLTPGVQGLVTATAAAVAAYASGPSAGPVIVAIGCQGGRHRAPAVGMALASTLTTLWGLTHISLVHRDIDKVVIDR
jgi:RNase adaptor protein for sRNA GlmZ degradation